MEKNPFSFYDFLGYMFPGLVSVVIIIHIYKVGLLSNIETYFCLDKFISNFKVQLSIDLWIPSILLIIFSYIIGHIIAYLSSITIEYYANKTFKYPSHYLLHLENSSYFDYIKSYFFKDIEVYRKKHKSKITNKELCSVFFTSIGSLLWRLFNFLFLITPVSFFFLIASFFGLNKFITRPLDKYIRNGILNKLYSLSDSLGLERPDVNTKADFHRIVMHYAFNNIQNSQKKTEKYIAMYGHLRSMCFISCIFTNFIIFKALRTIDFNEELDIVVLLIIIALMFICNIFFMAFIKYYRRFTLENYMAILTEKTIK